MSKNKAVFIHKETNDKYITDTEKIIQLEFENKSWLWDLPKDTIIECKREGSNEIEKIALDQLRLTMSIDYND